jgi:hypothetical protein
MLKRYCQYLIFISSLCSSSSNPLKPLLFRSNALALSAPLHKRYALSTAWFSSSTARSNRNKTIFELLAQLGIEQDKLDSTLTSQSGVLTPNHKNDILPRLYPGGPLYLPYLLTGWGIKNEFQDWHRYAKIKAIKEAVAKKPVEDSQPYGVILEKHVLKNHAGFSARRYFRAAFASLENRIDEKAQYSEEGKLFTNSAMFKIPFLFGRKVMLVLTNSVSEARALLEKSRNHNPFNVPIYYGKRVNYGGSRNALNLNVNIPALSELSKTVNKKTDAINNLDKFQAEQLPSYALEQSLMTSDKSLEKSPFNHPEALFTKPPLPYVSEQSPIKGDNPLEAEALSKKL